MEDEGGVDGSAASRSRKSYDGSSISIIDDRA